jgi:hypothetical protein
MPEDLEVSEAQKNYTKKLSETLEPPGQGVNYLVFSDRKKGETGLYTLSGTVRKSLEVTEDGLANKGLESLDLPDDYIESKFVEGLEYMAGQKFRLNTRTSLENLGKAASRAVCTGFIAHDQRLENWTTAYMSIQKFLLFPHLDAEEALEAGREYKNALWQKDDLERRYADAGDFSQEEREELSQNDGWIVEAALKDPDEIDLDQIASEALEFDEEDSVDYDWDTAVEAGILGQWESIYRSFRREAAYTIEPLLGKEAADEYAFLSTKGWKEHKVGTVDGENSRYTIPMMEAIKREAKAITFQESYPEKEREDGTKRDGQTGPGPLPTNYITGIENHDLDNWVYNKELMAIAYKQALKHQIENMEEEEIQENLQAKHPEPEYQNQEIADRKAVND